MAGGLARTPEGSSNWQQSKPPKPGWSEQGGLPRGQTEGLEATGRWCQWWRWAPGGLGCGLGRLAGTLHSAVPAVACQWAALLFCLVLFLRKKSEFRKL